jgi:predicted MFS family arabinose efflux permease
MPSINRPARVALITLAVLYLGPPAALVAAWALAPLIGEWSGWARTKDVVEVMGGLPAGFLGALVGYALQEPAKARLVGEVTVLGQDLSGLAGGTRAQGISDPVSPEARTILARYGL